MDFADRGILPLKIIGVNDETVEEIIICESIAGGANYQNHMPAELTLARKMIDGTEHRARYAQIPDAMEGQRQFGIELTALLNKYCRENQSGTPDFILAAHLISSLNNLDQSICTRRDWFGGKDQFLGMNQTAAQTTD